jgi:hypothetical protein
MPDPKRDEAEPKREDPSPEEPKREEPPPAEPEPTRS